MIQAVIFDRDGVLTYFDMAPAIAYLEPIVQLPIDDIARRWWQWRDPVAAPTDVVEEQAIFAGFWDVLARDLRLPAEKREQLHRFDYTTVVTAFPDARPALEIVKKHHLRTGVLSNFELASLDASLDAAGLADLIDIACAAPVIGVAKPDPEAYLTVARALSVLPKNCLYFDDEPAWVEGARAVGMHAYRVDRDRAEDALDQHIVHDLAAVIELLAQT